MTCKLQLTLEASGIEWPAWRNHVLCMAHIIQLAWGAFIISLGVKDPTKSQEAHEHDQQFGENEIIDIGKSQRLRKKGNPRNNKVSAMRPGLAKIIGKLCISRYFECSETDLHNAENASCIDYTETWSSKQVHWLSKSQSPHRSTTDYGCEDMWELDTSVAWASLPIMWIHPREDPKTKIHWLPATLHNTGWMDHCQLYHECFEAILILDPVDMEETYSHSASHHHSL